MQGQVVETKQRRTYDPKLLQQRNRLITRTPSRRRPSPRLLPRDPRQYLNALSQHVALLLFAERRHELVRVAMESDFVAGVHDLADLLGEGLGGVRGREPRGFNVVFVPESEQAVDADCRAEDAARDVGGVRWGAGFGVEPWRGLDGREKERLEGGGSPASCRVNLEK